MSVLDNNFDLLRIRLSSKLVVIDLGDKCIFGAGSFLQSSRTIDKHAPFAFMPELKSKNGPKQHTRPQ
jgi:hypothetical protein